ncbi:hypothetical protein NDR87_07730 [Nocardia sp. CDC159]|uniref:Uncharacterized protein n=1 Tax=Nocardia pulmonis TaxID=2951408 RepID=A0A9X2E5B1_9NOCA|nr:MULTISPECIES: hypothetical protein [Nocardia]MCM6773358.1 hypothetical protein [Nocardia pulmonis]MCM6786245.1 hypothetical protein [Nocardia sp. CDC159]
MKRVSVAGELRVAPERRATPLARHEFEQDGVPVSVVIERPEVDLAGIAWRCRVKVLRGPGRLEQSQVVGASASAVLRQALELCSSRLGISEAELLGGASVGLAAG